MRKQWIARRTDFWNDEAPSPSVKAAEYGAIDPWPGAQWQPFACVDRHGTMSVVWRALVPHVPASTLLPESLQLLRSIMREGHVTDEHVDQFAELEQQAHDHGLASDDDLREAKALWEGNR